MHRSKRAHARRGGREAIRLRAGAQGRTTDTCAGRTGIHRHATIGDQRIAVLVHRIAADRHCGRAGCLCVLAERRAVLARCQAL